MAACCQAIALFQEIIFWISVRPGEKPGLRFLEIVAVTATGADSRTDRTAMHGSTMPLDVRTFKR